MSFFLILPLTVLQWESGGLAPWLKYLTQAESNWFQTAHDPDGGNAVNDDDDENDSGAGKKVISLRPPAHTDRLYMSIGQMDVIEVQHPPLPDPRFASRSVPLQYYSSFVVARLIQLR